MKNIIVGETVSTFFLVLFATGSVILDEQCGNCLTLAGTSLASGLIVTLMILSVGNLSGAHMNPAISIGLSARKEITKKQLFVYLISQAVGGVLASLMLRSIFSQNKNLGSTLPGPDLLLAWFLELVMSMLLMLLVLLCLRFKVKSILAAILIGFLVFLEIYLGATISGASMNPIRSFAPALFSDNLDTFWIYLTAPVCGMLLANLFVKRVKLPLAASN